MSRTCSKCKQDVPKTNHAWCQTCSNEYEKARYAGKSLEEKQGKWLSARYGMSFQEYVSLYEQQDKRCPLCLNDIVIDINERGRNRAVVDHCHKTGKVRGLICNHCNRALGLLQDNKDTIKRMLEYV